MIKTDPSMKITGILQDKCIQCTKCISACPSRLFTLTESNEKKYIKFQDPNENCILCGHCLAICPTNAVSFKNEEKPKELPPNWTEISPSYQIMSNFLRSKRSIRNYKPEPVSKTDIQTVLDVIRYSPSASNARQWEFHVITNSEKIHQLSKKIVKTIKLTRILVKNPIIRNLFLFGETRKQAKQKGFIPSLDRIIQESNNGNDPIFFNAPCLIILHAPKYGNLAAVDSGIAITYGMLAAKTMNLATCWIGVAQEAMQRLPGLRKAFGLQRNQMPWGCFIMGKPNLHYERLTPRDPLNVTWE